MKPSEICAVLISYRPGAGLVANVELLCSQVAHIIVIDNTPGLEKVDAINGLERISGCTVIRNQGNLGIAAALNIGIQRAISLGYSWVITFDQDSTIADRFVETMADAYRKAAEDTKIGMLCPRYRDAHLGIFLPLHRAANGDIFGCLTSGAMIYADIFTSMGPMEEQLFIDYVDHEYCLRLRHAGYKIVECREAVLQHSLGQLSSKRLFGKSISITNHNPRRRYYINRNRMVLIKRYLYRDFEWALREFKGLVMDNAKVLLLENERTAKFGYMMRALFDGLFGRLGPRVKL